MDFPLKENSKKPLPGILVSLLPIGAPILLICIKAILYIFPQMHGHAGQFFTDLINFIGTPIIALSIGTLTAVYTLVRNLSRHETSLRLEEGLQSAGIILMVTGAGGALGAVVRDSGTGAQVAKFITTFPFSPIMIPFLISRTYSLFLEKS